MNMPEKTRRTAYEKHCVSAQKVLYIINESKNLMVKSPDLTGDFTSSGVHRPAEDWIVAAA
jgi:hypothetical protein